MTPTDRFDQPDDQLPPGRVDFGPLNSQRGRQWLMQSLVQVLKPTAIIETGTYLGRTTQWFAEHYDGPIYTIEADAELFAWTAPRLNASSQITALLGDSRIALARWATDDTVPKDRVLFYLDAHWNSDLPLKEEVSTITGAWRDSAIVIDDFRVPHDWGYRFDDYGPGRALTLSHLDGVAPGMTPLFPTLPSAQETGARRGMVLLVSTSRVSELVSQLPLVESPWPRWPTLEDRYQRIAAKGFRQARRASIHARHPLVSLSSLRQRAPGRSGRKRPNAR